MKAIVQSVTIGLAALGVAGLMLFLLGHNPVSAFSALFLGSLGSSSAWTATLIKSGPLLLTGLAVAIAFRVGIWNIGAEGQLYAGALCATFVATRLAADWPAPVLIPIATIAGISGGALVAGLAAWLRQSRGVSEVISTIMLNFIVIQITAWTVIGPLQESARTYPQSDPFPIAAMLPTLSRIHVGCIAAIALSPLAFIFLRFTPTGFRWRAVGLSPLGSRYAGIDPKRIGFTVLLISGALGGLAGAWEVMGVTGRLYSEISAGTGYTAIAVALLARLNPLAIVPAAIYFGALEAGGAAMQRIASVPASTTEIVQGLAILFVAGGSSFLIRDRNH